MKEKKKKILNIITSYFDEYGCYEEDVYSIKEIFDNHLTLNNILHLPDCSKNEYYKIFIEYTDHSVKEIKVEDYKPEAYIKEDWSSGWSRRKMTCCGADCTKLTQWMWPKYCPWCGAKLKEKPNE